MSNVTNNDLKIAYVADDFGWDSSANEAMIYAHTKGVLTSAALMMGQPGTEQAIELAKKHPTLEVGLHLHFCDSKPLTVPEWPWGEDPTGLGLAIGFQDGASDLVIAELYEQWKSFRTAGLQPAFINVHHHMQAHPWIFNEIQKLMEKSHFKGWMRLGTPHYFDSNHHWKSTLLHPYTYIARMKSSHPSPRSLWGLDRTFKMNSLEIEAALHTLHDGFHEFIFHPRHLNDADTTCLINLAQSAN